jgi:hypothetical protein
MIRFSRGLIHVATMLPCVIYDTVHIYILYTNRSPAVISILLAESVMTATPKSFYDWWKDGGGYARKVYTYAIYCVLYTI